MVKLFFSRLSANHEFGCFQNMVRNLNPQPRLVAFHSDLAIEDRGGKVYQGYDWVPGHFPPTWDILPTAEFLAIPGHQPVIWLTIHCINEPRSLSPVVAEDGNVYDLDSYRQNPSALMELYYIDGLRIMMVLSEEVRIDLPEGAVVRTLAAFG